MTKLIEKILELKNNKNALILAHYYQSGDIQDIADFVGDSYYLSKIAIETNSKFIIFCGVKFMAESAKILSPNKNIFLANKNSGCDMADMATENNLVALKNQYPNATLVCYINSSIEIKSLCDVCVTSGNALKVLSKINSNQIIFVPDKNLGSYLANKCSDKQFILYDGFCPCHNKYTKNDVIELKNKYPNAVVLAHPECREEVLMLADYVGSTTYILEKAKTLDKNKFIIFTEEGILHQLKKSDPLKQYYFPEYQKCLCHDMKKTTLQNILDVLETESSEIQIKESIRSKALKCLEQMHILSE